MKKILINLSYNEELRIAIINDKNILDNLYIININYKNNKSNIYKGKVVKIEPSLNAAFIDYGEGKNGFLSIKEISDNYIKNNKNSINKILYKNQELIVQVIKEEKKNKCAYLSTFICLAGQYVVLMPNNNKVCISRRINNENKIKIKNILNRLYIPENIGLIIRTNSINKKIEDIQNDINSKLKHWNFIKSIYNKVSKPCLIYNENNFILNIFRDYLNDNINEIIIDNNDIFEISKKYIFILGKLNFIKKIFLYNENIPLFIKFNIENQIDLLFKKKINLPSGGSIIIDSTEALTAIDVNSSKYKKGLNIEDTAFNTNLEATQEIAKQLRLRDISGLIVIDFIDMNNINNNKKIEENLYKYIYYNDKAKIKMGNISKFGLLELTRQRINNSINEIYFLTCNRCKGIGYIRNIKSLSIHILRLIENEIINNNLKELHIITPISIATYLLNEKRIFINNIEKKNNKIKLFIIPFNNIKIPNFYIYKIKNKNKKKVIDNYSISKNKFINNIKNKLINYNNYNNLYFKEYKENNFNLYIFIKKYINNFIVFIKNILLF
ncbi:Rne/Rng family ribonuclease [Candidatus Nardonella dryophthoridicola]|uniref:Rne/Rng family ribonuclease n=1 Tax=Candidatus Nardonella dryophthoridicola TaxID=1971485 RepID=UPI001AD8743C|nr:Rne/Rng family ribonuclease [Candidatus Nardonella dryophthoridicola]QTJ62795.1 Rne/Rng family ribonuclease [Candidatus Nardonella dryophthoridicola]